MDDRQNAKLRMYTAVETTLGAHPDALASIPAAATAADDFRDLLQQLRDAATEQERYTPRGEAKQALRDALTDAAVPVAQATAAWAAVHDDPTLAAQMDLHPSHFLRGPQQDAVERATIVLDHATAHATDLLEYGVTPDHLAALDDALDAFAQALGEPRHAITERKAHTEALAALFSRTDAVLTQRLDRLVVLLKGTPFHSDYQAAREIVG